MVPIFDTFMVTNEFTRCKSNYYMYFKKITNGNYVIFILYLDDMLVARSSIYDIIYLKEKLAKTLTMKDLDEAKKILRIKIIRDKQNHMIILS